MFEGILRTTVVELISPRSLTVFDQARSRVSDYRVIFFPLFLCFFFLFLFLFRIRIRIRIQIWTVQVRIYVSTYYVPISSSTP